MSTRRVTDQIVAQLEAGTRPWLQPWQAAHAAGEVSRPLRFNAVPYRGINVVLLWLAALRHRFTCPLWMTYRQAAELGGQVRRGEKGSLVVYANTFTRRETDDNGEEQERDVPFLKSYSVFNAEQIDGLPARYYAQAEPRLQRRGADRAGGAVLRPHRRRHPPRRRDGLLRPCRTTACRCRAFESFRDAESYYATLAHEAHALDQTLVTAGPRVRPAALGRRRLCDGRTGRRNGRRLPLRRPRPHAGDTRRPCRLHRLLAQGAARTTSGPSSPPPPMPSVRPITCTSCSLRGLPMRRDLRHYELPVRVRPQYRPVRVHAHEKGLAAFALDEYGLRFFRIMATGTPVPRASDLEPCPSPGRRRCRADSSAGRHEDALGYVVCEVPHASADPAAYPVPRRLTYRAKVTIAALQALLCDLADDPAGSAAADVIGFIERRIDQLKI